MPALANRIAPVGLFGLFSLMLFLVPRITGSLGIKNLCSFVRYLVIWLFGYLVFFVLFVLFVLTSCRAFKVQGSRFKVQGSRFKVQGLRFHLSPFTFHLSPFQTSVVSQYRPRAVSLPAEKATGPRLRAGATLLELAPVCRPGPEPGPRDFQRKFSVGLSMVLRHDASQVTFNP